MRWRLLFGQVAVDSTDFGDLGSTELAEVSANSKAAVILGICAVFRPTASLGKFNSQLDYQLNITPLC